MEGQGEPQLDAGARRTSHPACRALPIVARVRSQYPLDEIIEIPLKPPEDILLWLGRIGLLDDEEDGDDDDAAAEPNPGLLEEVPPHPPPCARAPVRRVRCAGL